MRRPWLTWLIALVVLLGLLVGLWFVFGSAEPSSNTASGRAVDKVEVQEPRDPPKPGGVESRASAKPAPANSKAADPPDADERRRRATLREQILAAQRAREASLAAATGSANSAPPSEAEGTTGGLNKRIEGHDELVAELNRDFMPLADECIEQALAQTPALRGMLTMEFEIVNDEDIGAVVESVDFPARDQVEHADLQECMRESLLSMVLPAAQESGREGLMLTLEVGTDED